MTLSRNTYRIILRLALYLSVILGAFGVTIQFYYMSEYIDRHTAPGANELLEGVAYATLIFGAFWIGAPLIALLGKFWFKLSPLNIVIATVPLVLAVGIWQWPEVL